MESNNVASSCMTAGKRMVYYAIMEDLQNYDLELKILRAGKLTSCGYAKGAHWDSWFSNLTKIAGWRSPDYDMKTLISSATVSVTSRSDAMRKTVGNHCVLPKEALDNTTTVGPSVSLRSQMNMFVK
jgi:hypothetical protein